MDSESTASIEPVKPAGSMDTAHRDPAGPADGAFAGGVVIGDRYRLVSRIAGGGMGEVWKATDVVLGRTVALKVLRPEFAEDGEFRERLRREARAASVISHPGVVPVFDFGEVDRIGSMPLSYLVMEFVDGLTLAAEVAALGPLGPERTLLILEQAAAGLEAAHEAGVIHRDVKPGNLIVTPQGDVKITDFGIAHASDVVPLTRTGALTGTARYLSPEQARGGSGTAASDVYSLGVVAYACLTGEVPFHEGNDVAIALAHVQQRPADLPGDIPEALRNLVMSMLNKDPADRPASAGIVAEVARSLRRQIAGAGDVTHPFAATTLAGDLRQSTADLPTERSLAAAPGFAADAVLGSTDLLEVTDPVLAGPVALPSGSVDPPGRGGAFRRGLIVAGVLTMLLVAVFLFVTHERSGGVRVPDVVGEKLDAAQSTLKAAGFRTASVTVDAPNTKRGIVARQSADADSTITAGSTVTLSVASGQVDLPVQKLVGAPYDEAVKILRDLGLRATMRVVASTAARGTVTAVNPRDNADIGSTVIVSVSGRTSAGSGTGSDTTGAGQSTPKPSAAPTATATPTPTVAPTTAPTPDPASSPTPTTGTTSGP